MKVTIQSPQHAVSLKLNNFIQKKLDKGKKLLTVLQGHTAIKRSGIGFQNIPTLLLHSLPQFEKADVPNPASGDWSAWQALLASKVYEADEGPTGAMAISTNSGFGTVCSSLIALPSQDSIFSSSRSRPKYLFSSGSPAHSPYIPVIS